MILIQVVSTYILYTISKRFREKLEKTFHLAVSKYNNKRTFYLIHKNRFKPPIQVVPTAPYTNIPHPLEGNVKSEGSVKHQYRA